MTLILFSEQTVQQHTDVVMMMMDSSMCQISSEITLMKKKLNLEPFNKMWSVE